MNTPSNPPGPARIPLVVDIDGSLLLTDISLENVWVALRKDFLACVWVLLTSFWQLAQLKRRVRLIAEPDIGSLPVRAPVLEFVRAAQQSGRPVVLASGSDQVLVDALARRLDLPGEHFGSSGDRNLTGAAKAALLVEHFGVGGFDYIGNAGVDLKVWRQARNVIVVGPGGRLARRIAALGKPVQIIGDGWKFASVLREMRPYQWVKNLLLFLPLLAAHSFAGEGLVPVLLAFAAFCAGTSAVYIANDLLDLETDRQHPQKRERPIAAGTLPIDIAMIVSVGLGVIALLIAWAVSWNVMGLLALYFVTVLTYSVRLKRVKWLDLFVLAALYTLRVLAGAVATNIGVSGWLLAFVFAVFFSLAIVKRLTELARSSSAGRLPGRAYAKDDMKPLRTISVLVAIVAATLFLAYSFSPSTVALYSDLPLLRLAIVPSTIWLLRIIQLSQLGQEDYDPVIFVEHDKAGFVIIAIGLALIFLAV